MQQWTSYFATLFAPTHNPTHPPQSPPCGATQLPVAPGPGTAAAPLWLEQPFTTEEVHRVTTTLRLHSAPGVDGLPTELFRYACEDPSDAFIIALTSILNRVWREGYPNHWSTSAVVPVPKPKGCVSNMDDYRGIAVGTSVSKILSLCLNHRLDDWAEEFGLRADGQYGFRKERGTAEAAFVLNHLVDKYDSKGSALYVAFVDFKKAYDGVDRDFLWRCLERLGVSTHYLAVLRSMYAHVTMRVRLQGALGPALTSHTGVKQGDPLSPLLFGLLIDRIESFFRDRLPHVGAHIRHVLVQILLYADDLALLATSPHDMQSMLNCLKDFCDITGLTVNIKKSEIVVFNSKHANPTDISLAKALFYNGHTLSLQPSFIYLGTIFTDAAPAKRHATAVSCRLSKARFAAHMLFRRCHSIGLSNVSTILHLFDAVARPVLNFGCEIWGPTTLCSKGIASTHDCEKWHRSVLRRALGVYTSTATQTLMRETNRTPLSFSWIKQILTFWNKCVSASYDDFVYLAMSESCELDSGWVHDLRRALRVFGCPQDTQISNMAQLDVADIMHSIEAKWEGDITVPQRRVRDIPDQARDHFKRTKYLQWFAWDTSEGNPRPCTYLDCLHHRDQINIIAKFRMGCHWLNCESQRCVDGRSIPRSERVCQLCAFPIPHREDEMHLFECPAYNHIRLDHQRLLLRAPLPTGRCRPDDITIWSLQFPTDDYFSRFMNGDGTAEFWADLANYLLKCKRFRSQYLENQPPN